MKTCLVCKKELEESNFHKDKKRNDGLNPWCRICCKEYQKNIPKNKRQEYEKINYFKNKDKILLKMAEDRRKNPEKYLLKNKLYKLKNPDKCANYRKISRERHKEERKIHRLVKKMVDKGVLYKSTYCVDCKKDCKTNGHHENYNKPFDVIWLCHQCHMKRHRTV